MSTAAPLLSAIFAILAPMKQDCPERLCSSLGSLQTPLILDMGVMAHTPARLLPALYAAVISHWWGIAFNCGFFPTFLLVQRLLRRLSPEEILSLWLTAVILGLKEITHERAAWGRKQQHQKEHRLPRERGVQGFIDMREITALASGPATDICDRFRHRSLAWNYFLTQTKRSK